MMNPEATAPTKAAMSTKPKRVHKPAEERIADILAAAGQMFAGQGYQQAEMQAVADAAGVGKGTVYRYFASKEELFDAVLNDKLNQLRNQVVAGLESRSEPLEQLREMMRAYLMFFENNPDVIELFVQERVAFPERRESLYFSRVPEGREQFGLPLFQRIQASCKLRDLPLQDIMDVGGDLIHGAVFLQKSSMRTRPLSERFDALFDIYLKGILAD